MKLKLESYFYYSMVILLVIMMGLELDLSLDFVKSMADLMVARTE